MCSLSEPRDDAVAGRPELETVLLGGPARHTKADVAREAGVELRRAERLWQAMGFAHVDDDAVVFTDADVAALRRLVQLVSAQVLTPEAETAVARSLGQAMSRLAEWQVGIFRTVLGDDFSGDLATTAQFAGAIMPVMEQLQGYVWRRHLTATAMRELGGRDTGEDERTLVIGFADIVGYTRLIRDFTELELASLIDDFEELATGVVAENRGRIIKTVGDEVLFVTDTAADGAEIALSLNEQIAQSTRLPPLRIGLAKGVVLARFGDVYGSTVNIASRLTSVARPASVLVDREVSAALRDHPDYHLLSVGPTKVQGFRGLRAWALRRAR
ncbi:adenylate/guanylate cyclase domain-containing protein [Saccharopolyspora erythraea]|uniref:adenylate/guanylate cyclase domain-containing protein n=1 Tax=Saccharopolyspora erythraea TaxID=1836 RepID=UPI001BA793DC|nr:adenylate/guanylate cyclase domain-containing protein [Saccharopolyspora erythraea]QUH01540.1 adenylate/guanylate cyclase domain-containing protein [Saccharopolyspora erythraea]